MLGNRQQCSKTSSNMSHDDAAEHNLLRDENILQSCQRLRHVDLGRAWCGVRRRSGAHVESLTDRRKPLSVHLLKAVRATMWFWGVCLVFVVQASAARPPRITWAPTSIYFSILLSRTASGRTRRCRLFFLFFRRKTKKHASSPLVTALLCFFYYSKLTPTDGYA